MKRLNRLISAILCVVFLLSGCSIIGTPISDTDIDESIGSNTNQEDILNQEEVESGMAEEEDHEQEMAQLAEDLQTLMPDVTFEEDSDGKSSIHYTGAAAEISVKDAVGFTWTLSIPDDALPEEETITMIPLKNVVDSNGNQKAGVLFEPSGLEFHKPAKLTVTGPGTEYALLFYGSHRGKDLKLAPYAFDSIGVCAMMFHFSTVILDNAKKLGLDPEDYKEMENFFDEYIRKAEKLIKKNVKKPKSMGGVFECCDTKKYNEHIKYIKSYLEEELNYLSILYVMTCVYLKLDDTKRVNKVVPLLKKVAERMQTKLDYLLPYDNPVPEIFYLAIASFEYQQLIPSVKMLIASAEESSYDYKDFDRDIKKLFENIDKAGMYTWDYLINSIAVEHNYRMITTAMYTHHLLVKVAGKKDGVKSDSERLKELQDASTFRVSFAGRRTDYDKKGQTQWDTEGEALVTFTEVLEEAIMMAEFSLDQDSLEMFGTGEGLHTHYSSTVPAVVQNLTTEGFSTEMILVPQDACFYRVKVGIRKFGSDDIWYESDGDRYQSISFNFVLRSFMPDYYEIKHRAVVVDMKLKPGQTTFTEEIDDEDEYGEDIESEYVVTLEHAPQL